MEYAGNEVRPVCRGFSGPQVGMDLRPVGVGGCCGEQVGPARGESPKEAGRMMGFPTATRGRGASEVEGGGCGGAGIADCGGCSASAH
eukprot:3474369-Pyramimonas_sp.AAC.1